MIQVESYALNDWKLSFSFNIIDAAFHFDQGPLS